MRVKRRVFYPLRPHFSVSVRVVVRYDKEGRLSSVEVSGDPAAVHQVLQQLLPLNQAPHGSAPSQAPEPEQPKPAEGGEGARQPSARRSGAQRRAQPQRQEQGGLPEFARDNPWLEVLSRKS